MSILMKSAIRLHRTSVCSSLHRSLHYTNHVHNTTQPNKIDITLIKQLRELVGAPINECKQALQYAQSNNESDLMQAAIEWLRKSGKTTAAKKSTRSAADGLICITQHGNDTVVITEINTETDFAAKNDKFADLAESVNNAIIKQTQHNNNISTEHINTISTVNGSTINDLLTDTITSLRENILVRRSHRSTLQPNQILSAYIHNAVQPNRQSKLGRSGAIVTLTAQTNNNTELTNELRHAIHELGNKIAMHIVAIQPLYANKADVPNEILEHERQLLLEQTQTTLKGKTAEQLNKIVQGKLNKYYEDNVLTEQKFVVVSGDEKPQAIHKVLAEHAKQIGVKSIGIDQFVRYAVGETVAPVTKMSFAEEVQSKMQ